MSENQTTQPTSSTGQFLHALLAAEKQQQEQAIMAKGSADRSIAYAKVVVRPTALPAEERGVDFMAKVRDMAASEKKEPVSPTVSPPPPKPREEFTIWVKKSGEPDGAAFALPVVPKGGRDAKSVPMVVDALDAAFHFFFRASAGSQIHDFELSLNDAVLPNTDLLSKHVSGKELGASLATPSHVIELRRKWRRYGRTSPERKTSPQKTPGRCSSIDVSHRKRSNSPRIHDRLCADTPHAVSPQPMGQCLFAPQWRTQLCGRCGHHRSLHKYFPVASSEVQDQIIRKECQRRKKSPAHMIHESSPRDPLWKPRKRRVNSPSKPSHPACKRFRPLWQRPESCLVCGHLFADHTQTDSEETRRLDTTHVSLTSAEEAAKVRHYEAAKEALNALAKAGHCVSPPLSAASDLRHRVASRERGLFGTPPPLPSSGTPTRRTLSPEVRLAALMSDTESSAKKRRGAFTRDNAVLPRNSSGHLDAVAHSSTPGPAEGDSLSGSHSVLPEGSQPAPLTPEQQMELLLRRHNLDVEGLEAADLVRSGLKPQQLEHLLRSSGSKLQVVPTSPTPGSPNAPSVNSPSQTSEENPTTRLKTSVPSLIPVPQIITIQNASQDKSEENVEQSIPPAAAAVSHKKPITHRQRICNSFAPLWNCNDACAHCYNLKSEHTLTAVPELRRKEERRQRKADLAHKDEWEHLSPSERGKKLASARILAIPWHLILAFCSVEELLSVGQTCRAMVRTSRPLLNATMNIVLNYDVPQQRESLRRGLVAAADACVPGDDLSDALLRMCLSVLSQPNDDTALRTLTNLAKRMDVLRQISQAQPPRLPRDFGNRLQDINGMMIVAARTLPKMVQAIEPLTSMLRALMVRHSVHRKAARYLSFDQVSI